VRVCGARVNDAKGDGESLAVGGREGVLKLSYPPAEQTIPGCPPSWCAPRYPSDRVPCRH